MFKEYTLVMHVDSLHGGIPKHPEIVRRWQEANWPANPSALKEGDPTTPQDAADKTVDLLGEGALDAEEKIQGIWTGFVQQGDTVMVESRQIKAMLKESANIIKNLPELRNTKGKAPYLRAQLAERVFPKEKLIRIGTTADVQVEERPIHVMTRQGPRAALKRVDLLEKATVECTLMVLEDGVITEDLLRVILDHASYNGFGTDRSQGNGTFTYELTARD